MAAAAKLKDPRFKLSARALDGRMRALGQKLTSECVGGPNVVLASRNLNRGSVAWSLQASAYTRPAFTGRDSENSVILAQNGAGATLLVGFTEEWICTAGNCTFYETRLRFYVDIGDGQAGPPAFRLEWSGYDESSGQFVLPGSGAGHPHWQFGVDALDVGSTSETADEIADELLQDETDDTALLLDDEAQAIAEPAPSSAKLRAFWKRMHFPSNAAWATAIWDPANDPAGVKSHAWSPSSSDDIDNWVISAVRYVQSEFRNYA